MSGTKQRITMEALRLFAQRGYHSVSVKEIAAAVGIGDSAIYKHFHGKQEIFDTILSLVAAETQAAYLRLSLPQALEPENPYSGISMEHLTKLCISLFRFYLEDEVVSRFRKMLTIEQFSQSEAGVLYRRVFVDEPLDYQEQLFERLKQDGTFREIPAKVMALHFYAPLFLLLARFDGGDDLATLEDTIGSHVKGFYEAYQKEN